MISILLLICFSVIISPGFCPSVYALKPMPCMPLFKNFLNSSRNDSAVIPSNVRPVRDNNFSAFDDIVTCIVSFHVYPIFPMLAQHLLHDELSMIHQMKRLEHFDIFLLRPFLGIYRISQASFCEGCASQLAVPWLGQPVSVMITFLRCAVVVANLLKMI